mgnify:FL=1
MTHRSSATLDTPLGTMLIEASESGLTRIAWSSDSPAAPGSADSEAHLEAGCKWVRAYFAGKRARSPTLDLTSLTPFQADVVDSLRRIAPSGTVVSYADLASAAGRPGASRAVGTVMATQPWPLLVPCHRVVRADGWIGDYSACEGAATKEWLLSHEGNRIRKGRIIR